MTAAPKFPPADHQVATLIDPSHIREAFAQPQRLTSLREAVLASRREIAQNEAISKIDRLVLRENDHIILVRIGARGGVKKLWDFGSCS